jgi:hypothetical protein
LPASRIWWGLGACDRIELRPALLRVLTDLYLQRPAHTSEDERCYCELALRLIDATDRSARADTHSLRAQ